MYRRKFRRKTSIVPQSNSIISNIEQNKSIPLPIQNGIVYSNEIILSPKRITSSKKDIYIFFHICCINNYMEVADELINSLLKNGLYNKCKKIFYSLGKSPQNPLKQKIQSLSKFELIYLNNDISDVEYPILINMQEFCNKNDAYVLYIHTKGVSLPDDDFRQNWRKRLIEKVIKENQICISLLNEGCDISGSGWKEKKSGILDYCVGDYPHYSGNFWWANSCYINKLPNLEKIKEQYLSYKKNNFLKYRIQCEFWIGMNKNIKVGINGELNKEYSNKKYYQENPICFL